MVSVLLGLLTGIIVLFAIIGVIIALYISIKTKKQCQQFMDDVGRDIERGLWVHERFNHLEDEFIIHMRKYH